MTTYSGPDIAADLIGALAHQISKTPEIDDQKKARHLLEAYGRLAKEMIRVIRNRPGMDEVQSLLDDLVETGREASAKVPYVCPECDELHHDSKDLCQHCRKEHDWNNRNAAP